MYFKEFLRFLPRTEEDNISLKLNGLTAESAIHQQMVQNLFGEHRFEEKDWSELARILLDSDPKDIEKGIRNFSRERILNGQEADIPSDVPLGRVLGLEQFSDMLVKLKYYNDAAEAKASIALILGKHPDRIPVTWPEHFIGNHVMWSTFNESSGRPFDKLAPEAGILLCVLGLPSLKAGYPLLVFEYRLPASIRAQIPTFCEAYAGDFWSRYFRPAPPGAPYGRTLPTETCPIQKGVPEVVHSAIKAKDLVAPLRYAT